MSHPSNPPS